jgi:formylglycine-generating enzyme required for sulfatase activity
MTRKNLWGFTLVAAIVVTIGGATQAAVPETVLVGDAGNKPDSTGYGAVGYEYRIGKYEVTNEEYCEFLNAVAKSDPHSLYDGRMGGRDDRTGEAYGGITRSGSYGSYTYAVKEGMGKKPVNYVTFESCLRYANWLTNGRGDGDTEQGSYSFRFGTMTVPDHAALATGEATSWVVASENEWYKAAYYDPDKPGGAGYWQYPAKSNFAPEANLNTNALSNAGSYKNAASPYGTYDQGGNVWEYNDHQSGDKVGLRGGSFYINDHAGYMRSATRYDVLSAKWPNYGFRVVALGGAESE